MTEEEQARDVEDALRGKKRMRPCHMCGQKVYRRCIDCNQPCCIACSGATIRQCDHCQKSMRQRYRGDSEKLAAWLEAIKEHIPSVAGGEVGDLINRIADAIKETDDTL
jgi:hypothetical protein